MAPKKYRPILLLLADMADIKSLRIFAHIWKRHVSFSFMPKEISLSFLDLWEALRNCIEILWPKVLSPYRACWVNVRSFIRVKKVAPIGRWITAKIVTLCLYKHVLKVNTDYFFDSCKKNKTLFTTETYAAVMHVYL